MSPLQSVLPRICSDVFVKTSGQSLRLNICVSLTRYDKTSECLAVRILSIKNIPRNNKDVSIWKRLTDALIPKLLQSPITKHMNRKTNLIPQIGMIYKTYLSICLFPDERSERRAYQASNTFRYLLKTYSIRAHFQDILVTTIRFSTSVSSSKCHPGIWRTESSR